MHFKMPIFTLVTNLPQSKISSVALEKTSELIADLFEVEEKHVLVSIKAGVRMSWGMQSGVFALGTVQNTDPIQAEDTKILAPTIFEFCEKQLCIPQNRQQRVHSSTRKQSHNLADKENTYLQRVLNEVRN